VPVDQLAIIGEFKATTHTDNFSVVSGSSPLKTGIVAAASDRPRDVFTERVNDHGQSSVCFDGLRCFLNSFHEPYSER